MRRLVPLGVAAAALALAGFAFGKGVLVTLGPSGPQPRVVTVQWGDSVEFVNGDSVTHGITSPRPELSAAAIAPGATYTAAVTARTGTYPYHQTGGNRLDGDVVVAVGGSVTLHATPSSVVYGRAVTISGVASIPASPVLVEQHPRGARNWKPLATVQSADPDGSFQLVAKPSLGTNLRASIAGGQIRSRVVHVRVAPRLTIASTASRTVAGRRIDVQAKVSPADAAKGVLLLACSVRSGAWKRVGLKRPGARGGALFKWRAQPGRSLLRVIVNHHTLVKGYSPGTSGRISVTARGKLPPLPHHRKHRTC